jgi:two-component system, NtrC family, nitrogen regulation sensor histidine kinase GlnL
MSNLSHRKLPNYMTEAVHIPSSTQMLAGIPLPVLLIGPDKRICYANDASEGFLGRSKKRIEGEFANDVLIFTDDRINAALSGVDDDIMAQDMEIRTSNGTSIVDISINAMVGEGGWRIIILTSRHGGRAYIGEHNEAGRLQALGAPAILGHEIKNPLAGIKGAAQLLARRVDASSQPLTELIVNEVDRIARLLDQMQNLGNSDPGILAPANIHLLIERAIRSIRAANKALPEISINYDPSLPDVMIDADAMVQVLINLMQNATDALDNKLNSVIGISTRFVMSGALHDAGQDRRAIKLPVEVTISDNGPGVPVHIEDEVFAPFVTTKRDGQGLGLAIVRKLITQMNSRILYERDNENGMTHFRMFLPVAGKGAGA